MGFVAAVRTCFRKYFQFSGRAGLAEFWWFVVFLCGVSIVSSALDESLFGSILKSPFTIAVTLVTALPALAVGSRRLHDTGRSSWSYWAATALGTVLVSFAIYAFHLHEQGDDPMEAFSGSLGVGIAAMSIVFVVGMTVLSWWLTRPSEPRANAYGPPPGDIPDARPTQ